jgi:positive regulator of sigma E activity
MKIEKSPEVIQHDGVVWEVGKDYVSITLSSDTACSGCHAESLCNISGKQDKTINITGSYDVSPGDNVKVMMQKAMGYKAVLLGYMVPLLIVIISLAILVSLGVRELIAGLGSISMLVPYFLILLLFRDKIDRSFTFSLKTD